MRRLVVSLLTVALLTGSAVGAFAQQPEPDGEASAPIEIASPPPGYAEAGPGYYVYGQDADGLPTYRFYDGQAWLGPEVDAVVALLGSVLSALGLGPETIRLLSLWATRPGGDSLLGQLFAVLLTPVKEPPVEEPPVVEPKPYQNYRLLWHRGNYVAFNGRVQGSGKAWTFTSSGDPVGTHMPPEAANGAEATCTFQDNPFHYGIHIKFDCEVTWTRTSEGAVDPWKDSGIGVSQQRGDIYFEFKATWSDGPNLTILSCEPDAVAC